VTITGPEPKSSICYNACEGGLKIEDFFQFTKEVRIVRKALVSVITLLRVVLQYILARFSFVDISNNFTSYCKK
jgi:hypothetical protein